MYNTTCIQEAADPGVITQCANTATEGTLFGGLSVALFFIFIFALRKGGGWQFDESITVASFACFVLTSVLAFGKFVNIIYPLGFLALLAFSGLYLWVSKNY